MARGVGAAVAITDDTTGSSVCAMSATFLSRITPITSGRRSGCHRVDTRKSARTLRIVRRVQQHATATLDSEQFESSRPFGCGQTVLDGCCRNRDAACRCDLEQAYGDDGVANLVFAAQSECHRPVRAGRRGQREPGTTVDHLRLRARVVRGFDERGAALGRAAANHVLPLLAASRPSPPSSPA